MPFGEMDHATRGAVLSRHPASGKNKPGKEKRMMKRARIVEIMRAFEESLCEFVGLGWLQTILPWCVTTNEVRTQK